MTLTRRVDAVRLTRLKEQIEAAFAEVPYPGDDKIASREDDWEALQLQEKARGKHWRDLEPLFIDVESPIFMSAAALQFYFPAYLIHDIDLEFGEAHHLMLYLEPRKDELDEAGVAKHVRILKFAIFNRAQREAIRAFIECYRDWIEDHRPEWPDWFYQEWHGQVDRALEYVWGPDAYLEWLAAQSVNPASDPMQRP